MGFSCEECPALGKAKTIEFPVTSGKSLNYQINSGSIQDAGEFAGVILRHPIFREEIMRNAAARSNLLVPEVREVMDIRQASDYLGISPDTLYKYASEGFVPAFKLGNRWRFKRSRLDEWMDRQSELHAPGGELDPAKKKPVQPAV
jgi:excisionase family DNA binding protein